MKTLGCVSSLGPEVLPTRVFPARVTDPGPGSPGVRGRGWLVGAGVPDTPCGVTSGGAEGNGLRGWHRVLD